MTELRIETLTMPAANLGTENPFPPLAKAADPHAIEPMPGIPDDMAENIRYGRVPGILPYSLQDGYDRIRRPRDFKVAVLENEILRATFMLELGGRLWSLVHKPSGRDLLATNPVFQPANLALRNAWFCGGVEWNIGTIGHSPFTCSPLFAARVERPDGTPVLRMYEWERIRQVPFQIDAYLPDGSAFLFLHIRLRNPHDREVPMYWWSNIAVRESEDTRVVVPATSAYKFGYEGKLDFVQIPPTEDPDTTYTTRSKRSMDHFFHIPEGQRPWITALDSEGKGLIQTSTARLKGRKLFMWGTGPGGSHWQEFLAQPGFAYLEIQAGLARTQLEHLRMPARADWSWLEAYGLMEASRSLVHGSAWDSAWKNVEQELETVLPRAQIEEEYESCAAWVNTQPVEILHHGSGWGALERRRRETHSEPSFCGPELPFVDETLRDEQQPWLSLLETGRCPEVDIGNPPNGFMVQQEWREILENSLTADGENWFGWFHLGIMRFYAGEYEAAGEAWERSDQIHPNAWALRNLAVLASLENEPEAAADRYLSAHRLNPLLRPLTLETCRSLLTAKRPQDCLDLLSNLPEVERANGRLRYLEALAAMDCEDFDRVARVLESGIEVSDLREGEVALSDLWFTFHERQLSQAEAVPVDDALRERVRKEFPLPKEYDFRMAGQ